MPFQSILKPASFLPGITWLCISFYLFTLPGNRFPKYGWFERIYGDKMVHIAIFALLVGLFLIPFLNQEKWEIKKVGWIIVLSGILYGTAIEIIQGNFVINRSFDVVDIIADAIGSLAPFAILIFLERRKRTG